MVKACNTFVAVDVCCVKARGMSVLLKWVVISRLWLVPILGQAFLVVYFAESEYGKERSKI